MDLIDTVIEEDGPETFRLVYNEKTFIFPRDGKFLVGGLHSNLFHPQTPVKMITDGKRFVYPKYEHQGHNGIFIFDDTYGGQSKIGSCKLSGYLEVTDEVGALMIPALFASDHVVEEAKAELPPLPVNGEEDAYLSLLRHVLVNGERRFDRTGVGTLSVFAPQLKFSLKDGRFPLLTTKRLHTRSIFEELFWFLRGETNNNSLRERGVTIWDEWAREDGELGPVYGAQWRRWPKLEKLSNMPGDDVYISRSYVDQIKDLITSLTTNPHGRRHLVLAWNPGMIHDMALPPCHVLHQYYVDNEGGLHCQMYQRSADLFLGVPFNIASYALLVHLIAAKTGLNAASLTMTFGDAHIYTNHFEQVRLQTSRESRDFPRIKIRGDADTLWLEHLTMDDVELEGYDPHPQIKAPVAK